MPDRCCSCVSILHDEGGNEYWAALPASPGARTSLNVASPLNRACTRTDWHNYDS